MSNIEEIIKKIFKSFESVIKHLPGNKLKASDIIWGCIHSLMLIWKNDNYPGILLLDIIWGRQLCYNACQVSRISTKLHMNNRLFIQSLYP